MSLYTIGDLQIAIGAADIAEAAQVARILVSRGLDPTLLSVHIPPQRRADFTVALYEHYDRMSFKERQAAEAILDALIQGGYDVNELATDSVLDQSYNTSMPDTALGRACLARSVPPVRALLKRGARPEASRAEALYNTIYSSYQALNGRQLEHCDRIAVMLLGTGLAPGLLRPVQARQLFAPAFYAALTLPQAVRRMIPGVPELRELDGMEAGLEVVLFPCLVRYVLERM